jgi:phospholipid/cholesterol/gamma-HCH transport system substrate-binding protein
MSESDDAGLPSAPPARGRDREVWVGLFVLLGLAAGLTLLYTLTDASLFRGRYVVTTQVPDAGGIRSGDPVQMRGVNIGRVQHFDIEKDGVRIRLEIEGEYRVPADSRVELHSGGLFGGMVADIQPGSSQEPLRGGESLPGAAGGGVAGTVSDAASSARTVLDRLQSVLDTETVDGVRRSVAQVRRGSAEAEALLKELRGLTAEQRRELQGVTRGLRDASAAFEKAASRPEIERVLTRLDDLTRRLDGTTDTLDRSAASLAAVLGRIERGEGTLGRLTAEDTLYVNLNDAALNLSRLLEDVRRNPRRYLRLSLF